MLGLIGNALVTGAAQGIGRATALAYAKAGVAGITIADTQTSLLQEVAAEARKVATNKDFEALVLHADVTNEASVRNMVERTVKAFGRIDYASNIAGRPEGGGTVLSADKETEDFRLTNEVNVYGLFYCQREELKAMRKQEPVTWEDRPGIRGSIVNMASAAGFVTMPGCLAYVSGKHAAIGMTKCAAADHALEGIRVNAVCPGYTRTTFLDQFKSIPDFYQKVQDISPMKRIAKPEEVADIMLFLSSPRASFVTGAAWLVDGGATIH